MPTAGKESLKALSSVFSQAHGNSTLARPYGRVTCISANGITVSGLEHDVRIGEFVQVLTSQRITLTEVIRIASDCIVVFPIGAHTSISLGDRARPLGPLRVQPDETWKGRVCSALGEPRDGGLPLTLGNKPYDLVAAPTEAMLRQPVSKSVLTGVKAIDIFTPLCHGQRIGIFAGSGVGKSTLLAMISKSPGFDSVVVALVGERGREVGEFVHEVLGESLSKSVVIAATSDEPPVIRKTAALMATTIAEYFRDKGENVLLIMDSVTRFAQASREMSLAAGEPPVARGYPPSVFSELPQLLERTGPGIAGSGCITGVYTVLVDGDDHNDPVADTVRGTLDGHIVLDRQIAAGGRYPAIDVLQSISRLADKSWTLQEANTVRKLRRLITRFEDSRDLRSLGGYVRGADPELDQSVAFVPKLYDALMQTPSEPECFTPFSVLEQLWAPAEAATNRTNQL